MFVWTCLPPPLITDPPTTFQQNPAQSVFPYSLPATPLYHSARPLLLCDFLLGPPAIFHLLTHLFLPTPLPSTLQFPRHHHCTPHPNPSPYPGRESLALSSFLCPLPSHLIYWSLASTHSMSFFGSDSYHWGYISLLRLHSSTIPCQSIYRPILLYSPPSRLYLLSYSPIPTHDRCPARI